MFFCGLWQLSVQLYELLQWPWGWLWPWSERQLEARAQARQEAHVLSMGGLHGVQIRGLWGGLEMDGGAAAVGGTSAAATYARGAARRLDGSPGARLPRGCVRAPHGSGSVVGGGAGGSSGSSDASSGMGDSVGDGVVGFDGQGVPLVVHDAHEVATVPVNGSTPRPGSVGAVPAALLPTGGAGGGAWIDTMVQALFTAQRGAERSDVAAVVDDGSDGVVLGGGGGGDSDSDGGASSGGGGPHDGGDGGASSSSSSWTGKGGGRTRDGRGSRGGDSSSSSSSGSGGGSSSSSSGSGASTILTVLTLYLRLHLKRQLHYLRLGMMALFTLTGIVHGAAWLIAGLLGCLVA